MNNNEATEVVEKAKVLVNPKAGKNRMRVNPCGKIRQLCAKEELTLQLDEVSTNQVVLSVLKCIYNHIEEREVTCATQTRCLINTVWIVFISALIK